MGENPETDHPPVVVVADTGPLIHLGEIGALDLLRELGRVTIPDAVAQELRRGGPSGTLVLPDGVEVLSVLPEGMHDAAGWRAAGLLHLGEAEAIALAHQIAADWLLTDDAAARSFARDSA
jgi:predicted nucleic acid-binding protein